MMRRLAPAFLAALLACPFTVTGEPAAGLLDARRALRESQEAIGRTVGDHTLLDREGRPVRLAGYLGKPLLVSFVYTGCFQVCPTTTRSLAQAVSRLAGTFGADRFNVISIGFNQPFDSPAAMRAFAAQMQVGARNWEFLSAPQPTIDALTRTFGFTYAATPAGFDHVVAVSVVDAEGRIVAQVYGEKLGEDALGEPLRRLLRNMPVERGAPFADLIERVRILCTVYDPETGTYRTSYALPLEIAGGATFAIAIAWFFALEWRTQRRLRRGRTPRADGAGNA